MCGKVLLVLCLWYEFIKIPASDTLKFPENFIFGTSTSCYQVEGAWNVSGKGEHVWDRLTHTRPDLIEGGQNGDDSAKSYYLYKNDSDLLKEIGFNMYRFSISWTRILPNGDLSEVNQAGIQHYNDIINDLIEKNIEPMVTIHHWDLPQKLHDVGGWLNSSIIDHITNYADLLFSHYGDRVKWWITINEPCVILLLGYYCNETFVPVSGSNTSTEYIVIHNMLLAHMRIYRLYESKYKESQKGNISISLNHNVCFPKTQSQEDLDATERFYQFMLGIVAHPIYSVEGDYPKLVKDTVYNNSIKQGANQSRLPEFTEEEKSSLIGSADYFGINHYTSVVCSSLHENVPPSTWPFIEDMVVKIEENSSLPKNQARTEGRINPEGFKWLLNRISKDYNNPAIFVTENGYGGIDEVYDTARIDYHKAYLTELLNAYHYDKNNIIGYNVWSLLDNFEWLSGYRPKYGIISVDFNSEDRKRTRKLSSYFFQTLIESRELNSTSNSTS